MFNLYEILQNAQGGEAVANLARQFNITPEQADTVLRSLAPDFSAAFMGQAGQPGGFAAMLGAMADPHHAAAFADAAAANSRDTMQKGAELAGQLFGPGQTAALQNAAQFAGIPASLVQQMLPVIASMLVGGLSKAMANQGWGGMLGQLAGAASQGGLGQILSSMFGHGASGAPGPAPTGPQAGAGQAAPGGFGGLGGVFGQILGNFFNPAGAGPASPSAGPAPGAGTASAPTGQPHPAGFDPSSFQAAIEALTKMLQPGAGPASPAATTRGDALDDDIGAIFSGRKKDS